LRAMIVAMLGPDAGVPDVATGSTLKGSGCGKEYLIVAR